MFKTYSEIDGYFDEKNHIYHYDCTVEDTDFIFTIFNTTLQPEEVVYRIYSDKQLDVVKNFVLYMLDTCGTKYPISSFIEGLKENNYLFDKNPKFADQVLEKLKKIGMFI